jgi:hypothetical protein
MTIRNRLLRLHPTIPHAYRTGFEAGYRTTRRQVAEQALTDIRQARPASEATARWLEQLADLAGREARTVDPATGQDIAPPLAASLYHTPLRRVVQELGRHRGAGLLDRAAAIGQADGAVAARLLTTRELADESRYELAMPVGPVDGLTASSWLDLAAQRWRMVAADQPRPLAHTTAAVLYDALAGRDWYRAGQRPEAGEAPR